MKWIYKMCGGICVGLGVLGAFLPLLPTTPFLLLAAFCFSRGSPRMHRWLLEHRMMGAVIKDWEQNRVIRPRAKKLAVVMLVIFMSPPLILGNFPAGLKVFTGAIGVGVIALIYSYPSRPQGGV